MKTNGTHKGGIHRYTPPKMDEDQWYGLFDTLLDTCFRGNISAVARALEISRNTAIKWSKQPPKRYWELEVLHRTVKSVIKHMQSSIHKKHRDRATKAIIQLRRAGVEALADELEAQAHFQSEAIGHLISTIAWTPGREIKASDLYKTANSGGFSKSTLRKIAQQLNLEKETAGFSKDKETWFKIPR